MRVVQLGPYPPPHGGVQSNLVAIHRYLKHHGATSHVINLTRHRAQEGDGVFYPCTALQVLRLLLAGHYDVVHLHLGGDLTGRLVLLGLACAMVPGASTVITFHSGGWPSSDKGKRTRRTSLAGLMFRRTDQLIAVNQEIAGFFRRMGVPEGRIRLIAPHDLPFLAARDAILPTALEEFFRAHRPVLVTVGLLEPEYDLPLQLDLVQAMGEEHPGTGLVIVGSGSLESSLRQRIEEMGLGSRVRLCGDVPHNVTLAAMARAAVLLRTTHYDGDSVAVREALHLGTPVIASDNGMRPPGVILVPGKDLAALHHAVAEVLSRGASAPPPSRPADDRNIAAVFELYRQLVESRRDR